MYSKALSVLALATAAQAHMSMFYPPPLGGAPSINKQSTKLDSEFNYPLGCCGPDGGPTRPSPGLCRGYLDRFDIEKASVTWQPGQDAHFQLTDYSYDPNAPGGTHSGGSCQVGFSVDKGATWKVAASYHGACPHATTDGSPEAQTFDFKVPTGMPEGDALFAWVWINREHESFMNCAKVQIGSKSGSTPAESYKPAQSATTPKRPSQSNKAPAKPSQPGYSSSNPPANQVLPSKKPLPSSAPVQQPDTDDSPAPPTYPSHTQSPHRAQNTVSVTTTVLTTIYDTEPTKAPSSQPAEAEEADESNSDDSDCDDSDDTDSEDSEDDESDSDDDYEHSSYAKRAHREVKQGARRFIVEDANCECSPDELSQVTRCACNGPEEKRAALERKALRMHRRSTYKRVDACNWASAPRMEVSYFTEDAKCAPNAKLNVPESDNFELKWDVSCGVVEGTSEYTLKTMTCDMYSGKY